MIEVPFVSALRAGTQKDQVLKVFGTKILSFQKMEQKKQNNNFDFFGEAFSIGICDGLPDMMSDKKRQREHFVHHGKTPWFEKSYAQMIYKSR